MKWTGFYCNPDAWATSTVSAPSVISTSPPSKHIRLNNPTGPLRVQFIGEGADNSLTGAVALYAITVDDYLNPKLYISQLYYNLATSTTLSGASLAVSGPNKFGREGTIRWADTLTGGTTASGLAVVFDNAWGADATDIGTFSGTDVPAELIFGNARGLWGLAWAVTFNTSTAFNIFVNHERGD